jgi:hypothetical protein
MSLENEQAPAPAAATEQPNAPPAQIAPEAIEPEDEDEHPDERREDEGADELGEDGKPKQRQPSRSQRYKEGIARREARIAELEAQVARNAPPRKAPQTLEDRIGKAPEWGQYNNNYAAYTADLAAYRALHQVESRRMVEEQRETEARETMRRQSLERAYVDKHEIAKAELPDFDKVVRAAALHVERDVAELIMESDHTARLEYYLAKNPNELTELNRMSPVQAAKRIGRLEAQLSPSAQNRSTQAPAPLAPIRGGAAGPRKGPGEMPMEDFAKWLKAK